MQLEYWHGGSIRHMPDSYSGCKSKMEYGPGLYVTNNYWLAKSYAKGNNVTSLISFETGRDISECHISVENVTQFIYQHIPVKRRLFLKNEIFCYSTDMKVSALTVLNFMLSDVSGFKQTKKKSQALHSFLIENGVDSIKVSNYQFGSGNTDVYVILNFNLIEKLTVVPAKHVSEDMYDKKPI